MESTEAPKMVPHMRVFPLNHGFLGMFNHRLQELEYVNIQFYWDSQLIHSANCTRKSSYMSQHINGLVSTKRKPNRIRFIDIFSYPFPKIWQVSETMRRTHLWDPGLFTGELGWERRPGLNGTAGGPRREKIGSLSQTSAGSQQLGFFPAGGIGH